MKPGIAILGAPRSGTTLLRRIIDAHPNICCGGETFVLKAAAQFIQGDSIVDGIDYGVLGGLKSAGFDEAEVLARLRELCFGFLSATAAEAGKPRWATKTAVDAFYVDEIERIFGDHLTFVCMVRHGADVVLSTRDLCEANEVYLKEYHRYVSRYPRPLVAFAHAWADVTARLLDLVDSRPNAVLIRYEDLIESPDETIRNLCAQLDEPCPEGLVAEAFSHKAVQGLGDWKTFSRGAIHSESLGRFHSLSPHNARHVGEVINPVLARCGYEPLDVSASIDPDGAMRRYELSMMFAASEASR